MMKPLFPEISVDGVVIAQERIAEEAQNHPVEGNKPGLAWRKAAQALIVQELLLAEAARRGLSPEIESKGAGVEIESEALIRALVEDEIDDTQFDDDALESEYQKQKDRMQSPALYGLSHILFAGDDAEMRAQAALAELSEHPARFEAMAGAQSDCPSGQNGGYLGQMMARDFVPEFHEVLPELKLNSIHSNVIPSRFGYHILRLDQKIEGKPLPEDYAKGILRENMEKYAWVNAAKNLVDRLNKQADIKGVGSL